MKKKVIVRGDRSGVFFGELVERMVEKLSSKIVVDYGIGMVLLAYRN